MRRRASHVIRPVAVPVVRFRLAALFAAQFFDLGTFSLMVGRHGVTAEVNPIVAQGFADWGMLLVVVAKLALIVLVGSIVVLLAEHPRRRSSLAIAAVLTVGAVVAGFAGGVSNLAALRIERFRAVGAATRPAIVGLPARSPGGQPGLR
jgi:hypothetical protein